MSHTMSRGLASYAQLVGWTIALSSSGSASPLGSSEFVGEFPTIRCRFVSPASKTIGSSLANLPTDAMYQRARK